MKITKVLLAEDDSNLGMLLKNYLSAKSYDTTLLVNGIQALEEFPRQQYELCILDIMMPEMDGLTLAKEIRKINPVIPIIFLTAKSLKEDILEGFRTGADDYITKPFSMEELLYRIQAILKRTAGSALPRKESIYAIGNYSFDPLKQMLSFENQQ